MKRSAFSILLFTILFFLSAMGGDIFAASSTVTATIQLAECGNAVVETGEGCDGANLNGQSCVTLGFVGGSLSCSANCTFNNSGCSNGGGGGGGTPYTPATADLIFSGRAYPQSKVYFLKDGQIAANTIVGTDANFNFKLSQLVAGSYVFGVYTKDIHAQKSSMMTYPLSLTANATVSLSGIFIPPTTSVDKTDVKRGDNISIFGQSAAQGDITIAVNSAQNFFLKTKADKDGIYLYTFDTSPLDYGQHSTKAKAAVGAEISAYGDPANFKVSAFVKPEPTGQKIKTGDFSGDARVNLIDFSIVAYWYKRPLNDAFKLKEKTYLNGDGKVDLKDFSIMAYHWTG
ncbi:MAG: hypothetical protein V1902_01325 [Candidatus Falkowbacteria bacterium]